ncbi:MAG: flagellar biosynthesis protein FlgL [Myxococcaceae bacterium]|nr:flagellar biosynthesis protein FlgL [Myxococcaceae bacterium]
MRVTDKAMFASGTLAMNKARTARAKAIDELSSGMRVTHPWDDPSAAGLSVSHDAAGRMHGAVSAAVRRANDELASVDAGLGDVVESLSRARELAVQLSNDTYSAAERAGGAAEVTGLFQSVVASLNREVAGRYVFGGFRDNAAPFDAAGNFGGDGNIRKVEVAKGVWQDASIDASQAIKGAGGGVDVLATLQTLSTALAANDTTTLRATLDTLTQGITQVSQARSKAGAHSAVLDVAALATRALQDQTAEHLSNEVEANPFEAASRLALAERGLEATIESVSRTGKLSLLGKM